MGNERTPTQWFEIAKRFYSEKHQGCAWCGESYCVYNTLDDDGESFQCNLCDFHVAHNEVEQRHYVIPGEVRKDAPVTMHPE